MKILYHHRIRSKDGQFVHISELVAAFERRGTQVVMCGPRATEQAEFGDDGGMVAKLKRWLPQVLYELMEIAYGWFAVWRLWAAVRREQPDAIYERYNLYAPAGALVRKLIGIPLILEVNAPLADERARHDGLGLPKLARAFERWTWRSADAVIVVTEVLGQSVVAAGVPRAKIHVMPNGIDLAHYAPTASRAAAKAARGWQDTLVLGFVGFVRPWHGLAAVIEWLAALQRRDVMLVIAGDAPHVQELLALAERLEIQSQVVPLGLVARAAMPGLLQSFDVALQPAAVPYASPLKLVEYMAAGCAIVAPDQPNIREVVADERTALLFGQGGMALAIERLIDDAALRGQLGRNARQAVIAQNLTWDHNAGRVQGLIEALPAKRASKAASRASQLN